MCLVINALGNSIPPMFVFPLVRYDDHFVRDGPERCIGSANRIFQTFRKQQVLLILDNHASHLYLPVINFCRDNFITLLSFPPHTSHKLQQLDRGVYGPLKKFYNNSCDQWMKNNPGAVEYDPLIETSSRTTNLLHLASPTGHQMPHQPIAKKKPHCVLRAHQRVRLKCLDNLNISNIPCEPSTPPKTSLIPPAAFYSPEEIRPLPKADFSKLVKTNKRAIGKTIILTDTPEKNVIEV
ncbi:hypothetical protein PPYR_00013 [Photinus pyralis]|uniref:DDE-1 domain-containing protein n=1 Tax=Photinus pyralis TaxID=7054 RepID=A0A5N4B0G5_PHOPY|nr:hypothetical protein PPYR_00013 [Photinus pyralis]